MLNFTKCALILALVVPAFATDSRTNSVDKTFAQWAREGSPGCSVAIYQQGRIAYEHGYGTADLEHGVALTPSSVFDLASVSKQFTAASIVLLAERGQLKLSDSVRKYVPELPEYADSVTIDHLIHHTSGIRDYLSLLALANGSLDGINITNEAVLQLLARQKALNFRPGEQYQYSNSGYFLLGTIVGRVSGKSLREFAQENIFGPLGMKHTHYHDDHTEIVKDRAVSYLPNKNSGFALSTDTLDVVGDGGVYSTVEDLFLWDRNFYTGQVGGPEFLKTMLTPGKLNDGTANEYAFGLVVEKYRGLSLVQHSGGWQGYATTILRFPEQQFSVVCLCNTRPIDPVRLSLQIADLYLADKLAPPTEAARHPAQNPAVVELENADLQQYAGEYHSDELQTNFRFTLEGNRLKLAGRTRNSLLDSLGVDDFLLRPGVEILFTRGSHKQITGFTLAVRGGDWSGPRPSGLIFTRVAH